ncbi:putative sulfate/molybdate transporter [Gudongella sp. DL1XJH-153]|uniref:putative sulfate/molybdate transporter n=1 Tax=Gudongella sp. DL1XJH-153 TaxID=3409804 RepID=UPI003BB5BF2E
MKQEVGIIREKDFRFTLDETAGALGDFGTLLPIVIGVSVATDMDLSRMLFFFAIAYIGTGLYYKMPMPVEPMKVIGVIAIAEGLSSAEIAGAGIGMGLILFLVGITGMMVFIKRVIPLPLVRGIQLGLAMTLSWQAFKMIWQDPLMGMVSILIVLAYAKSTRLDISALVVFVLGIGVGVWRFGVPELALIRIPSFILPDAANLMSGFVKGTLPQIPLTMGNAVLATSLLISDLLDRQVKEKHLLYSMSAMCIFSVPFGGFPMCHGAGGLAAQYRFGARTGGSNIISGLILLFVAVFFATPELELIIPFGALGALLFYSGLSLFRTSQKTGDMVFTWITGMAAFVFGMTWAFLGMFIFGLIKSRRKG